MSANGREGRIGELVSPSVMTILPTATLRTAAEASIDDAARAMADAQIRHLAVTRDGQVVGVVPVRDVLRILVS